MFQMNQLAGSRLLCVLMELRHIRFLLSQLSGLGDVSSQGYEGLPEGAPGSPFAEAACLYQNDGGKAMLICRRLARKDKFA
jgi:hypothetical protein